MDARVVIVGGGQAGYQVAHALRAGGHDGTVTLACAEPVPPYQRPPLSKGYLLGRQDAAQLPFRPASYYADRAIDLRLGVSVVALDRGARAAVLSNGERLPYDVLVLATGARMRRLRCPGAELDGVVHLRTRADADELRQRLAAARRVIVIGGGFIGLEAAAAARQLGKDVAVVELADRVLGRVVAPPVADWFSALHRAHGVELLTGMAAAAIDGQDGRVGAVVTTAGRALPCDLAIVGIGVEAETVLAEGAGLACANGVCVDRRLQTSDPAIFAAGDCASFETPFAPGRVRLESVQNAADQGRIAAANMLGRDMAYDAVPWFWTEQYDAKLQMVGLSHGHDRAVLRGQQDGDSFSVLYFRNDRLIAVDSVNRPADHMAGRKLLAGGTAIRAADVEAADFDLKRIVAASVAA